MKRPRCNPTRTAHRVLVAGLLFAGLTPVLAQQQGPDDSDPALREEESSWYLVAGPTEDWVNQVEFIRADKGWLLSESGGLYEYDGRVWREISPPTEDAVSTFSIVSENELWCATHDYSRFVYFIWHYRDGQWSDAVPVPERILDFSFVSSETGWATGENGLILRYHQGQWRLEPSPTLFHLRSVEAPSPTVAWAVGEYGNRGCILHFDGTRWSEVTPFPVGELGSLAFPSAEEGWAAGRYDFLRYVRGGWSRLQLPESWQHPQMDTWIIHLSALPPAFVVAELSGGRFSIYQDGQWRLPPVRSGLRALAAWSSATGPRFVGITAPRPPSADSPAEANDGPGSPEFVENPLRKQLHIFGVAIADVDNDGFLDPYLVNTEAENVLLHRERHREGWFQFVNRAEEAKLLAPVHDAEGKNFYDSGALFGDVDNDGLVDLFLSSLFQPNKLYKNLRNLRFKDVTDRAGVGGQGFWRSNGAAFADADNDGDLDLFVTNLHASNRFYLNNGVGFFADQTEEAGLETEGGGVGATFGDIDNDGDADLFVAIWGRPNLLYENLGPDPKTGRPRFLESAERRGLVDPVIAKRSQGGVFGDIDNDGDLDLFVTNVLTTNRLYRNDGRGYFTDITEQAGVTDSARSNSANVFDADHDGDLDLFVTNKGRNAFYVNHGDGTFEEAAEVLGFGSEAFSVGSATGDLDKDGDIDLVVANYDAESLWMRNGHNRPDFLALKLVGVASNRDAIGARVYLYPAGHTGQEDQLLGMREICAGSGYYSMNSTGVHFGVDENQRYDVVVRFPSGISRVLRNLEPGQTVAIDELDGWAARRIRIVHWLRRAGHVPRNRRTAAELGGLLVLLASVHLLGCGKKWWNGGALRILCLPPLAAYLIAIIVFFGRDGLFESGVTYTATLSVLAWSILSARRRSLAHLHQRYEEEVALACAAFEHGAWAAKALTRLQFLFGNLEPEARVSETVSRRILEAIQDFELLLAKELKHIASLAESAGLRDGAAILGHHQIRLTNHVAEAKVVVSLGRPMPKKILLELPRLVDGIREQLRQLHSQVGTSLYCRLRETLDRVVKQSRRDLNVEIEVQPQPPPDVWLKIRAPEFATIVEELLANAATASRGRPKRAIRVDVLTKDDSVVLEVSDTGCGIPRELWDRIFDQAFTTGSDDHSGFGLYYAREILSRYGGTVRVKSSTPGEGTTFELQLRRFDHE